MPKVVEKGNFRVEVTAEVPRWGGKTDQAKIDACEEIASQIKRHVDGLGEVRVTWDLKGYCSHCHSIWTETSAMYNGGCCDEDEKNNQNQEPAK